MRHKRIIHDLGCPFDLQVWKCKVCVQGVRPTLDFEFEKDNDVDYSKHFEKNWEECDECKPSGANLSEGIHSDETYEQDEVY